MARAVPQLPAPSIATAAMAGSNHEPQPRRKPCGSTSNASGLGRLGIRFDVGFGASHAVRIRIGGFRRQRLCDVGLVLALGEARDRADALPFVEIYEPHA